MVDAHRLYTDAINLVRKEYLELSGLNPKHPLLELVKLIDGGYLKKDSFFERYDSDERNTHRDEIGKMLLYYYDLMAAVGEITGETGLAKIIRGERPSQTPQIN